MASIRDRLKELFEITLDGGITYDGLLENIDYYGLFCKAAAKEKLYKIKSYNVCMFNHKLNDQDAVMMIFYIPVNSEESSIKNIAERVMDIINEVEKCFTTLDFVSTNEVKEEKFIYVTIVKKVK